MNQLSVCLIIFVFTLVGFSSSKLSNATTAMVGMAVMMLTGCLTPEKALSAFSNTNTILMGSMFVVAAGLNRTQMVNNISAYICRIAKGSFQKVLAGYVILTCILVQFIPSALVGFSIVYPLALSVCREMNVRPSKMIFSLGFTAIGSVVTFPVGSAITTFAQYNGFLESFGYTAYNMSVMDIFYGKFPILLVIVAYAIFVAPRFAPDIEESGKGQAGAALSSEPLTQWREVLGYATFVLVLAGLIFSAQIGLKAWQVAFVGALIIAATGVLKEKEIIASLNLPMLFLFIGAMGIGNALTETGAGELIGKSLGTVIEGTRNNYIAGFLLFIVPFTLTQFMLNQSVNSIFTPLYIALCKSMGCSPIGPILLLLTACLTAYMTPMATPSVPVMMAVGGYDTRALIRMSLLPAAIICVVAVGWIMTLYPLF